MPGIKEKLKAANKKRKAKKTIKNAKKNTTVSPVMKKVASKTQDPVRSGSAGSGKVTKSKKLTALTYSDVTNPKKMYKAVAPKSLGGSGKKGYYKGGGFIQYD